MQLLIQHSEAGYSSVGALAEFSFFGSQVAPPSPSRNELGFRGNEGKSARDVRVAQHGQSHVKQPKKKVIK